MLNNKWSWKMDWCKKKNLTPANMKIWKVADKAWEDSTVLEAALKHQIQDNPLMLFIYAETVRYGSCSYTPEEFSLANRYPEMYHCREITKKRAV